MASLNGFNAAEVEPAGNFEAIPAGNYLACIVASEMKPTKAGNGEYLKLTWEVIEGDYKGRKLWCQLNIKNPSVQAVNIARGELSAICRACGVITPNDSAELHNIPLLLNVRVKKDEATGNLSNEIKGYKPKNEPTTPSAPRQPVGAGANGGATAAAPWKR
jgi:hypothetical protein